MVAERRVVEALEAVKEVSVEEALETKPAEKRMPVEVAWKLSACLVNGKAKVSGEELVRVPVVRERPEPTVSAFTLPSAPMYGILERSAEAVMARFVVVA